MGSDANSSQPLVKLCSKIGSGATPRGGSKVYLQTGEISLIRSQNVLNNSFTENGLVYIDCDAAKNLNNVTVEEGDVLLNITGDSVARCCQVADHVLPARVNQHVAIIRPNREELNPQYLKYFLVSPHSQNHLLSLASAGATRNALTKGMIESLEIPTPPMAEQNSIAHILGTLDDKIELNRRMNETLESMARALFKSWFVDFDPVIDNALAAGNPIPEPLHARAETRRALGAQRKPLPANIQKLFPDAFHFDEEMGWIPGGWKTGELGDFATVRRGGSPRPIHDYLTDEGLPWVKIRDATSSPTRFLTKTKEFIKPEGLSKTVMLGQGTLILSNSATPGLPMFLDLDACIHDGWLHFPETRVFSDYYLYQLFLVVRSELLLQGNGSVFTNLKTDILRRHGVVVPPEWLLGMFDGEAKAIHLKLSVLQKETESLTKLRDTLLPKLLSGELRIPDAEQLVAGSLRIAQNNQHKDATPVGKR